MSYLIGTLGTVHCLIYSLRIKHVPIKLWTPFLLTIIIEIFLLRAFVKLTKTTVGFVISIRRFFPNGTTRLPLNGFSQNLILDNISKIGPENSVSLKSDKNDG
jgi:hypothetical protein